jgi:hypothetical protein
MTSNLPARCCTVSVKRSVDADGVYVIKVLFHFGLIVVLSTLYQTSELVLLDIYKQSVTPPLTSTDQ